MRRMLGALAALYRRWKYVEEDLGSSTVLEPPSGDSEPLRTQQAIERGERLLADYRRNGCAGLVRECEANLRSLRTHLDALNF
jgi:hypothetical protein